MTEKEIAKLTRKELVEMLLDVTRENDRLKDDVDRLTRELKARRIAVETSGTMAEAAMKLNRVFEAADAAAKQYLQNVKARADAGESHDAEEHKTSHDSDGTHSSHHHRTHSKHDVHRNAESEKETDEPKLVMPEDPPKVSIEDNPFSVSEENTEN